MKRYAYIILCLALTATACLPMQRNQEFDSNGRWHSQFCWNEFLNGKENEFTLFAEAARHSGWMAEIEKASNTTYLIPSDEAFSSFLSDFGIPDIQDIPATVLYRFLSYFMLPSKIASYDFGPEETIPFISKMSKPVYLSRVASGTNPYRLMVNAIFPEGIEEPGGPSAEVLQQDLFFKNDIVVHVLNAVPYYAPAIQSTDTFTGKIESDKITRIDTDIDTYIYNHAGYSQALSARGPIACNSERIPVIWYENKDLGFNEEISKATAYFYRAQSNSSGVVNTDFSLHDISDQVWSLTSDGTNRQALLDAVIATFLPTLTLDNYITTFPVPATANTWFNIDITSFIKKYYASSERKPIGLSIKPIVPFNTSVGFLPLGWKNNANGSTAANPSYIEVMGPVPSKTVLVNNNPLLCKKLSSVILDAEHLKRAAAPDAGTLNLAAHNIIYSVLSGPKSGCLTLNDIPLVQGFLFSQAQIDAGIVKYYNTDSSISDFFTLRGSDYTGSIVTDPIEITVTMQ